MATEADIPAPRKEELGESINNISINTLPQEEKTQRADTPNESCTVEGEDFLKTPSISQVHSNTSSDASTGTEKPGSSLIRADGSYMEHDDGSEISTGKTNDKVKDEDDDLSRAQSLQSEKNSSASLNEQLHVIPENSNETTSYSEEQSTNVNLHGITSDVSGDKKIDAVDTHNEVFESSLTIGSNEETEEKSKIEVDGSARKTEEFLEKESDKLSSAQPLVRETSDDDIKVMQEARNEDGEQRKADLCEIETSTESMSPEIESKIEKLEDSLNVASEGVKTSSFEEKSATTYPQDGKTDDSAVIDAAEIKEESHENVQPFVSNEKMEENSLIQVDGSQKKDEENLEKDSELKPSLIEDLGLEIESSSFEEQSAIAHSQIILDQKIEDKSLDAAETKEESLEIQNVSTIDLNEKTEGNSQIQDNDPQKKNEEHLEKDIEQPSLGNEDLLECEKKLITLGDEDLHVVPENSKSCNLDRDDETASSLEEQSTDVNLRGITSDVTDVKITDAVVTPNEVLESCSTVVSNNPEEGSTNVVLQGMANEKTIDEVDIQKNVLENSCSNEEILEEKLTTEEDRSETKNVERPEKDSDKPSSPEPLEMEASYNDEFIVKHEAQIEDVEPRKTELREIETSKRNMLPEIESKIEKPEDSLNVASEDIKTSDSSHEAETSSFEEKSATHPHDGNADDKALDADKIKEEIYENVQPIVPDEKTGENSLIQVDGSQKKDEENLVKDSDKQSLIKDRSQEIETSSFEEQNAHSQIILDQKTEDKAFDAAETKEETLEAVQNVSTRDSNEKTEENLLIQDGGPQKENEEHSEKDIEKRNSNDNEINVTDDVKSEDVNSAQLLENNKASDLGQHAEKTLFSEDQILSENPQGTLGEKTENETTHATDINEKAKDQQNVVIEVSNEDGEKNSSIQQDAPQTKHDAYLEKEIEKQQLIEPSTKDINDESTERHEAEISNESIREVGSSESDKNADSAFLKKENFQEATEDHKPSVSREDIETTCSTVEQSSTENPQSITSDKTSDATETKEINLENVATDIPHEHTEENLEGQVDCSQMENEEHLVKESVNLPIAEASVEETNDNESKLHESKDLTKAELLENDGIIASNSVKEDAQVKMKHTDSSQESTEDIKAPESTHDTNISSGEGEILTAEPQEISNDKKEETCDEKNSLVEEDGSDKQSLKEVSLDDNVSAVTHEATFVEEHLIKAVLLEEEKHEGTLVKEQVPIESLQVADEDIKEQHPIADPQEIPSEKIEEKTIDAAYTKEKTLENVAIEVSNEDNEKKSPIQLDAPQMKCDTYLEKEIEKSPIVEASTQDINDESTIMHDAEIGNEPSASSENIETTCSIDERSLTDNPQSITSDKTSDITDTREINYESTATEIPHEHIEENLAVQVGCSQTKNEKQLDKESENVFLTEASSEDINNDDKSKLHEPKDTDEDLTKAELLENERNTINAIVKEEAWEDKHTDYLQAAHDDIKASESTHVTNMSSTEEEILTEEPKEISNDNEEETTTDDAAEIKTRHLQDIQTRTLDGDDENNSLIEDGSDKLSSKEISLVKADDNVSAATHEKFVEEHLIKADLLEEEKPAGIPVKEQIPIESLKVADEDIKAFALVQDREIISPEEQSLIIKSQRITGDSKDKTKDATIIEKEPQHAATATSYEDNEENSQTQGDVSQLEHTEYLKKESENTPPLTEASDRATAENALVKEETEMDKPTDYMQVATEDIKASVSCQGIETSSIKDQNPIADPQEISSDKIEEKTIDAAYTKEKTLEDVVIKVPNQDSEDNLPKEAIEGNANDDESINVHEVESVDENLTKVNLFENEKIIDCTSVEKEGVTESLQEANEDIKAFATFQDQEKISLVEQDQIMGDKEDTITEATNLKKQTPEEKNVATIPDEDSEENSLSQVDSSETEQKELLKKESENSPLNASIEYVQIVTGDIKASASGQDTEIRSKEEQISDADIEEISCDVAEEKTTDASYTREELIEDNVESPIMHEAKYEEENIVKAELVDNEQCTEGNLVNEKVPIDSLLVGAEEVKASASSQERETSSREVQSLTTNSREITSNHNEQTIDATKLKEETGQDKNTTTQIPDEEAENKSLVRSDCSQIEPSEYLEKEIENPSLTEAQTEDTLLKEKTEIEKAKDSFQVAAEDIKSSTLSQDTETCFTEERIPTVGPQEISGDETKEKVVDVTDKEEETLEFQDIAKKVPRGENEHNSPTEVDCSQKPSLAEALTGNVTEVQEIGTNITSGDNEDGSQEPSLTEASDYESNIMHEPRFVDESFQKADLVKDEKNTDGTVIKEENYIESLQVATEDIKASASGQDGETSSQEEQSSIAYPQENVDSNIEGETIDPADLKDKVSKEKATESVAVEIPSAKDSDVNRDTEVDIAEDHNCKQQESPITTASEEHMAISNEHVANVTSSASEPSEQHEKDKSEPSEQHDIDKPDSEKMTVLDDGSTKLPTNENLVVLKQQDTVAGISEDVSESNKLNYEERTNSNNLNDASDCSGSVALDEVPSSNVASETDSTPNPSQEYRKETQLEAENEEAQKQDEDNLHVSAPVQESSTEKIEKDFESCPEISREMQKLEEAPLDEITIRNTDCKESEDASTSFLNDNKITEKEHVNVLLNETVEEIKEPASIPVDDDVALKSLIETSETDRATADLQRGETRTGDDEETKLVKHKEEETGELIISDFSSPALNITEASDDKDGANKSIEGVDAKLDDDEAPEIIHTAPSATESQEVEGIRVGETSVSISEYEREHYYKHANIGTEEKTDLNEVGFAPEESKAEYEVRNQVLDNVQNCGMISKAEENLETAAEKSDTVLVEDIIESKETSKINISSEKINEEDVKNDNLGSCKDITEPCLEHQGKQEENTNTGETFEVIKNANEAEKVSKFTEQADDEPVDKPQENVHNNIEDETIDATHLKEETSKEKAPESVAVDIPSTKGSNINREHVMIINEHAATVTSLACEPSEQQQDTENMTLLDDGSTKIPTIDNLVETGPTESSVRADAQVPDEENKSESKQDQAAGISEDVSESNLRDISETDSTPNPSLESAVESAAETEEAQKQDEDGLCVSAPVQDPSTEKIEKDIKPCPTSAIDSEITQEEQKLKQTPLRAPEEKTVIGNTDSEKDATKIFLNDEKHTERELEETECKKENILLGETVEETEEPASVVTVGDDVVPKSFTDHTAERHLTINRGETCTNDDEEETKLGKDKEEGAGEQTISDFSSGAPDIIEARDNDESKIYNEAQEIIQIAPTATEIREVENIGVGETSASISQCERDDTQSNEFGFVPQESKTGYEVKNQVLHNVQSCGMISKAEENLEAAAATVIKSERVMVEDIIEPSKIKEEDEDVKNDHLGSCKEEAITQSHLEDQPKQEERTNSEGTFEVIKNAKETEKVSKVYEEADDKVVEEKLRTNESIDRSLNQKEQGKSVDDVTTILGSEEVHELGHSYIINTGTQDSEEEGNRSSVKVLEDEDKSTNVIDNEIAKDEGLLNQISKTSVQDAVSGEQPKRPAEDIICEAPPAQTVPQIIEDGEGKTDNADTIMTQHRDEEKHELNPLEKQNQNDEICRSDELQTKDEVNLMLSAEKGEEEAKKEDTLSKPTKDEYKITYVEAEKVDISSHTTQSDKKQESQRQINSLPILPVAECSDIKIAEKDLPTEFSGLEVDHTKNIDPENSIGNKNITTTKHELPENPVVEPEKATCEHEENTSSETAKSTSLQAGVNDEVEHENTKTDEEKDESSEQRQLELCSEAPVMVDAGDADFKVAHKKPHNILSGVGSKVKHSIAKVKKAITGKSSHPKPPSPK